MKNLKTNSIYLLLALIFISCNNQDSKLDDLIPEQLTVEELFTKIIDSNIEVEEDNMLFINFDLNQQTKQISSIKIVSKKANFDLLFARGLSNNGRLLGSYTVECSDGTSGSCDGAYSCGKLMKSCLDGGGCATICAQLIAFDPMTNSFYLLTE